MGVGHHLIHTHFATRVQMVCRYSVFIHAVEVETIIFIPSFVH